MRLTAACSPSDLAFTLGFASLVPTLPNVNALQAGSASRVPTCYYGQGKCQ